MIYEVAAVHISCLLKTMIGENVPMAGVDVFQTINQFCLGLIAEKLEQVSDAHHFKVVRSVIKQGSLIYIPQGYIVFERVVDNSFQAVLGIRTAVCTCADAMSMHTVVKAYARGLPQKQLSDFWTNLLSIEVAASDLAEIKKEFQGEARAEPEATAAQGAAPVEPAGPAAEPAAEPAAMPAAAGPAA